ncbi:MAG: hypothetical protein ACD_73C00138G0002 [uncultured bacterium]|nr:MAG: hypothetical protein ACD_73C00138G0002 [uncultured bacterium]
MSTRISTDLENPVWIKLLKLEASETNSSMKDVLIKALETYFAHRLENKALQKASEAVFTEWNDVRDSAYDTL